jgi:hypothetical protein
MHSQPRIFVELMGLSAEQRRSAGAWAVQQFGGSVDVFRLGSVYDESYGGQVLLPGFWFSVESDAVAFILRYPMGRLICAT